MRKYTSAIQYNQFKNILKFSLGASIALLIAQALHLENIGSAAIIALLTMMTTRKETINLSILRIITFCVTIILCYIFFNYFYLGFISYGLFLLSLFIFSYLFKCESSISINAVIGTHYYAGLNFTFEFLINEFLLIIIGITIALILNMILNFESNEDQMKENIKHLEEQMQECIDKLSDILISKNKESIDIEALENRINHYLEESLSYKKNTFGVQSEYYYDYFYMRNNQFKILKTIIRDISHIQSHTIQSQLIGQYLKKLGEYIKEYNHPIDQIKNIEELYNQIQGQELPKSRDEFEERAILYHIVHDIKEFLYIKQDYIQMIESCPFPNIYN